MRRNVDIGRTLPRYHVRSLKSIFVIEFILLWESFYDYGSHTFVL